MNKKNTYIDVQYHKKFMKLYQYLVIIVIIFEIYRVGVPGTRKQEISRKRKK